MNTNAYNILKSHEVTRLCHFTRFQSLTSILSSENGIIASKLIQKDVKNVTDNKRLDGKTDHICCTIEYPNSWYFQTARKNNNDKIFIDWVVLYKSQNKTASNSAEFQLSLTNQDIIQLKNEPMLKTKTFGTILKIIELLLKKPQDIDYVSKKLKVDKKIVDLLSKYIKAQSVHEKD